MWTCPDCGKENDDLFCSHCGIKQPENHTSSNETDEDMKGMGVEMFFMAFIFILIAGIVVAFLNMKYRWLG